MKEHPDRTCSRWFAWLAKPGVACLLWLAMISLAWSQSDVGGKPVNAVAERFRLRDTSAVPDFQQHVVPLLGKLGCNSAKCHGSFQGQGGFKLSLFGFDFRADLEALHGAAGSVEGARVRVEEPEKSLVLLKPIGAVEHGGGKRLEEGSWQHHLLLRWIESGATGASFNELPEHKHRANSVDRQEQLARDVIPILEDHCFECHGFGNKKGNLSLQSRAALLEGGQSGPAVVDGKPAESLLIRAVRYGGELKMPPGGQLPLDKIQSLEHWVREGAPFPDPAGQAVADTRRQLLELICQPAEIIFTDKITASKIRVFARWQDGTREEVTGLVRFQSNNDSVARVDATGFATSVAPGDTHIVALYDNGVAAVPVLRPVSQPDGRNPDAQNDVKLTDHPIDRLVVDKLNKLGIEASPICSDSEFLRRVSIDMTGSLPTPQEVVAFTADTRPDKRQRKVDELLSRTTYAAWWANKLCDFTGCNPASIRSLQEVAAEEGYQQASRWYDWIFGQVDRNVPYDQLVKGIMLADLNGGEGMPIFWRRQSLQEPKDTAMSVAHAFLGIQLQCAECHKHPFDQWTQTDFRDFARFFDRITNTKRTARVQQELSVRLLRSKQVSLQKGDDARKPIMDWMREQDEHWLARAFVNRVWASYFHVGIVEPPDQFTPANPPSHPELLQWLTDGFVEQNYDMKWLHRQIATSVTYQRSWRPTTTNREDRRNFSRAIPRRIPAEVIYDALKQSTAADEKMDAVRTNLRRRASGHLSMRMAGTHAMKVFGKPARSVNCDCERVNEPTLLQAIFTQNDPLVRMRLHESEWIINIEDAEARGDELKASALVDQVWLRTVNRLPDDAERARALTHLQSVETLAEGIGDLMWAMVNTKEYLLNH